MRIITSELDNKKIVGYLRTDVPKDLPVFDSDQDIFDTHLSALKDPKKRLELINLLDSVSLSRNAALRLDFVSDKKVDRYLYDGAVILVEDPKFDLKTLSNRSGKFGNRLGVVSSLTQRADELIEETREANGALTDYRQYLVSYVDIGRRLHADMLINFSQTARLFEADTRDLVGIADAVLDVEELDPELTLDFMHNLGFVVSNIGVEDRERYLDRTDKHRTKSIDELIDFARYTREAFVDMDGELKDSINYASVGIALERRFGDGFGEEFRDNVKLGLETQLPFSYAIKFGTLITLGKIDKAGKVIGNANGLNGDSAIGFGNIYYTAARGHGIENAMRIFVPAYFKTIEGILDIARTTGETNVSLDLRYVAEHVDPAVAFFTQNPEYMEYFDSIINNALAAVRCGISRSPNDSFYVAMRSVDIGKKGGDVGGWFSKVKGYVKLGGSLYEAVELADQFEKTDSDVVKVV